MNWAKIGARAGVGALSGLGWSLAGGAVMGGDQSQLGGMIAGAGFAALTGTRIGRYPFAHMTRGLRRSSPWWRQRAFSGVPGMSRALAASSGVVTFGTGAAGLIGSTVLESNSLY